MKLINAYTPILKTSINDYIKKRRSDNPDLPWSDDLLDRLQHFATSGKLLRGNLICFSYEALSGQKPPSHVIQTAIAFEMIHTSLLIHDDIMDRDSFRRGQISIHAQYEILAKENSLLDSRHFGESMAICSGDAALFIALGMLAETDIPPDIAKQVNILLSNCLAIVCSGQMQDLYLQLNKVMPTKSDIYKVMNAKTASYSIAMPLILGATLAQAEKPTIEALKDIGRATGIIFQIRDDELGLMGDIKKLGKPIGSDVKEGKKTLIYYYLMSSASAVDKTKLMKILGNSKATKDDIQYVRSMAEKYGVRQLINQDIANLTTTANEKINDLGISDASKSELKSLVDFCSDRHN